MPDALAAAVDQRISTDVSLLVDAAVRAEYVEVRNAIDRLEAHAARLLASAHHRQLRCAEGMASTPSWSQSLTGQRWTDAKASLDAGLACEELALTAKAWAQGEISSGAARTIARGRKAGHEAVYADVEPTLVAFAAARDHRGLDAMIRHYQTCADALDDTEPADRNHLHLSPAGNRWVVSGDLDDLAGHTFAAAIDAATDEWREGEGRSAARRRADALTRISRFFLDHGDVPRRGGEVPHVSVVIDWASIRDGLPCPLTPGVDGPTLSPTEMRRVLCDARVSRIVAGPDSQPLDVGRSQRTVPRWIRRAVVARDRCCRFPGCDRPPQWCEVHHVEPWESGGETAATNLVLLCPYHHHLVHRRRWRTIFDGTTFSVRDGTDRVVGTTRNRNAARAC